MSETSFIHPEQPDNNLYRFTRDNFECAKSASIFAYPERMELSGGIILEHPQQSARHTLLTNQMARELRAVSQKKHLVYGRRPVNIDEHNQPTADVVAVSGAKTDYCNRHPSPEEVVLLVEVSDTTVTYDLGGKAVLYARAGIADYWVVLVNENAVVVHRDPTPSGYSSITRLAGADTLSPLALPEAVWTTTTLLGREDALEEH